VPCLTKPFDRGQLQKMLAPLLADRAGSGS
jgi:hypothetical protein